ncbi:MAG: hypothetical protein KBD27_03730 [Candidatus Moranbacteria bacterium]|nr:hypothetical protein [Candidatus Moranbacteria bacterium]
MTIDQWAAMMAQGYGGVTLLVGVLYAMVQRARRSKAFFTWSCFWRLVVFEAMFLVVFCCLAFPLVDMSDTGWSTLVLVGALYVGIAMGLNWAAFATAHDMARLVQDP